MMLMFMFMFMFVFMFMFMFVFVFMFMLTLMFVSIFMWSACNNFGLRRQLYGACRRSLKIYEYIGPTFVILPNIPQHDVGN